MDGPMLALSTAYRAALTRASTGGAFGNTKQGNKPHLHQPLLLCFVFKPEIIVVLNSPLLLGSLL